MFYRKERKVKYMSILQEQAVQMIGNLSDDNVSFLIEIIHRLMPQEKPNVEESRQAFQRLDSATADIRRYFPEDFDPDAELKEARAERYDSAD